MKVKLSTLFWSIKMSFLIHPVRFIFNIIVTLISSLIPTVLSLYTGKVIDNIVFLIKGNSQFLMIIKPIIILGVFLLLNLFFFYGSGIITSALDVKISMKINERFIKVVNNIPLRKFDDVKFCDDFSKAQEGFGYINSGVDNIFMFLGEIVTLFSSFAVIFSVFPAIIALIIVSFIIGYKLNMSSKKKQHDYWEDTVTERRYSDYLGGIFFSKGCAKEVRNFNLIKRLYKPWYDLKTKLRVGSYIITKSSNLSFALYQLSMDMISLVILGVAIFLASKKLITLGNIIVLWQLSNTILMEVQTINGAYSNIYYNNEKILIARQFIEKYEKNETDIKNDTNKIKEIENNYAFELNDVSFAYVDDNNAVENVSLKIPKGQVVAICGENGSGKSTLIKLLLNLYKPNSGEIFINGININQVDSEYIKKNIGAAFQDFVCYPFYARENIGFGNLDDINNDEKIFDAVKKGDSENIIKKIGGVDQLLGKSIDSSGHELSGGEWQRIALSRANMGNKPIMIFDEPAAKLDPISELKQFEQIRKMLNNRTAILVSHRIGFARLAQRILVMKDGHIVEDGTHEELIKRNGEYKKILKEQAQWYDTTWNEDENYEE